MIDQLRLFVHTDTLNRRINYADQMDIRVCFVTQIFRIVINIVFETITVFKCFLSNEYNTFREDNLCQAFTVRECIISDGGDSLRDDNLVQIGAVLKS